MIMLKSLLDSLKRFTISKEYMERNFILLEEILKKYLAVAQDMTKFSQMDDEIKDTYWFYQGQMTVLPTLIKLVEERDVDEFWKYINVVNCVAYIDTYNLPSGTENRYIYAGVQTIIKMINTIDEIV